jgi:hypothetical protein
MPTSLYVRAKTWILSSFARDVVRRWCSSMAGLSSVASGCRLSRLSEIDSRYLRRT